MIRLVRQAPAEGASAEGARSDIWLDLDERRRRRGAVTAEDGTALLVDLAETPTLRDGDGLVAETGEVYRVRARAEALMEIGARDTHHLVRLAWHLGNRHLPTQIVDGETPSLRIRADHVIAGMAETLGGTVRTLEAPFDPEGGAYGHGGTMGHDHHHGAHERHHHHAHSHTGADGSTHHHSVTVHESVREVR